MIDLDSALVSLYLQPSGRRIHRGWRSYWKTFFEDVIDPCEPVYWADYDCTPIWPLDRLDPIPVTMVWVEDRLQA